MRILIDANIYLNYYRQSPQSYNSIDKLIKLLEDENIELIIPKQVSDEFERNKEREAFKFIEALKKDAGKIAIREPSFYSTATKIKQLKNLLKKVSQLRVDIITEYKKRIENENSKINKKLENLFSMKIENHEDDKIIQQAYFRTLVGNPPRKKNSSFGDAIIWEILLKYYTDDDLTIISGDGDFSQEDQKNNHKINLFLEKEWNRKAIGKKIKLYETLGGFINSFTKKGTIDEKIIQEEKRYSRYDNINRTLEFDNTTSMPVHDLHLNTTVNPLSIEGDRNIFTNSGTKESQISVGTLGRCIYCGELNIDKNSPCSNCGRIGPRL